MTNDELLTGYFEGSLTADQQAQFDRLLQEDAEFKAGYDFQKEVQLAVKKRERLALKEMLAETGAKIENRTLQFVPLARRKKPGNDRLRKRRFAIHPLWAAASVLLVIVLSVWWLMGKSSTDNLVLYARYFEPYQNVVHPIERNEALEDLQTRAFAAYERGDFGEASQLFAQLNQQQAEPYIIFYNGIALMELGRHDEAIPLFESYISQEGELKDRARWYLALAWLKTGNKNSAQRELEKLIETSEFKNKEAKELIRELD